MADPLHAIRYQGESDGYRAARTRLLQAELDLRRQLEAVAALRRELPLGGRVETDYVFEEATDGEPRPVRLSELFAPGKRSLVLYSYMYGPAMPEPCPMCTSFLDGIDAYAPHLTQRVNLAVVAKSPANRLRAWASRRGWKGLRLPSSAANSYNPN